MKLIKKLMAAALCAAVALGVMCIPAKAEAADVAKYDVRFDDGKWYFSLSGANSWASADGLNAAMKDGDVIVIDGVGTAAADLKGCEITITKRIGELAVTGNAFAIVYANGGVDLAYGVGAGTLVVNGNVNKLICSNVGTNQVNGNVNELVVNYPNPYEGTDNDPQFAVSGKVGKATVKINSQTGLGTYYNIAAGKCIPDKYGILWLDESEYSKDASAATTPATSTTATSTSTSTAKTEKKLDDVPKTGSTGMATSMAFFAMAAVLAVSAVAIKRREQ